MKLCEKLHEKLHRERTDREELLPPADWRKYLEKWEVLFLIGISLLIVAWIIMNCWIKSSCIALGFFGGIFTAYFLHLLLAKIMVCLGCFKNIKQCDEKDGAWNRRNEPDKCNHKHLRPRYVSSLTCIFESIFYFFEKLSPLNFYTPTAFEMQKAFPVLSDWKREKKALNNTVDFYIMFWILMEAIILGCFILYGALGSLNNCPNLCYSIQYACATVAFFRIADLVQAPMNNHLFNHLRVPEEKWSHRSSVRSVLLIFISYFEIIICFSFIYFVFHEKICMSENCCLNGDLKGLLDSFYFSVITQITIGYGDLHPEGWARVFAAFQGLIGFFYTILLFSRLVGMLPELKEEK